MASTGSADPAAARRAVLKALAAAPVAWAAATRAEAAQYGSPAEVFGALERLEADVAARLRALAEAVPLARPFADSVLADQRRHQASRRRLQQRLGLPSAPAPPAPAVRDLSLAGLRTAQEALVYAHAEGLPALGDADAVGVLARNMNDLSRQLTVVDLWIEAEQQRG